MAFVCLSLILCFMISGCEEKLESDSKSETSSEQAPTPQPPENQIRSEIYKIVKMACQKIVSCNEPSDFKNCMINQVEKTTFGSKLGLSLEEQKNSLRELIESESEGQIVPDVSSAIRCINSIYQLDCSDTSVIQAYDPLLEEPYQSLAEILPADCQSVFNF